MTVNQNLIFSLKQQGKEIQVPATQVIDMFHQLYYTLRNQTWQNTFFLGRRVLKCPLDLWIYQEIFVEVQPDLVIETGTFHGGTAIYYAILCDLLNNGHVVSIDTVQYSAIPAHPRITYLSGSSVDESVAAQVREAAAGKEKVIVILDSDHSMDHVLKEMEIYGDLVTPGSYMIVEDTCVNGHPVSPEWGPGPMEAVEAFLQKDKRFTIDRSKEKFMMTLNPSGYLKRAAV